MHDVDFSIWPRALLRCPSPLGSLGRKAIRRGPSEIIAPVPAGGTSDMSVRLIGQWLSDRLGQPFVVENRPGAATNIGTEVVVRAAPDGYTLLGATGNNATNATIYDKLNFNFIRDIAPVARTIMVPLVLEEHPSVPAETVAKSITLQGQSGQNQYGVVGQRITRTRGGRAVQYDDGCQVHSRAVSR